MSGDAGGPGALRELRTSKQLPAKDMVAVVRELYPKFDKPMLSKCENGDSYGVNIRPDAIEALYSRFAPEILERKRRAKSGGHRLTCRIYGRLENDDYAALQQYIKADGYATMQDWLTAVVRQYLREKTEAER